MTGEATEATARQPLLSNVTQPAGGERQDTISEIGLGTSDAKNSCSEGVESMLLGSCTLALVLVGIALVLFVSFFPFVVLMCMRGRLISWFWSLFGAAILQSFHLRLLWVSRLYLRMFRTLVYPIRKFLFPLVAVIARIESYRDGDPTFYASVTEERCNEEEEEEESNPGRAIPEMKRFRKSIRRHYRRMQKIFVRSKLKHQVVQAEKEMKLQEVIPILWEHEQRICAMQGKSIAEEFIKRFLVVTVVPDGILDLYWNQEGDLVCFQFSVLQGNVFHWFMYFAKFEARKSGIWWHGALLALLRGIQTSSIHYVNAQTHQEESKRHAGYESATESYQLDNIYPINFSRIIPSSITSIELWNDEDD